MKKRFRIVLVILLVGVIGALAWLVLGQRGEPVYKGIRLSAWLKNYDGRYLYHAGTAGFWMMDSSWVGADEAVRHIGTNAIPTLLRLIRAQDSDLKNQLGKVAAKLPLIKFQYVSVEHKHIRGVYGLLALGVAATNVLPELLQIYQGNPYFELQIGFAEVFGGIGPPAKRAIPLLLLAATNQTFGPYFLLRRAAIWALGEIHAEPGIVVPVLTTALRDTDPSVRLVAIGALDKFGPDAKAAVPALIPLLNDRENVLKNAAKDLLEKLAPETVPKK